MKTQHTPGPWHYRIYNSDTRGEYHAVVYDPGPGCSLPVCNLCRQGDSTTPNGRLIAAAPELLAALETLTSCATSMRDMVGKASINTPLSVGNAVACLYFIDEALAAARAAIAKAEGNN